MGILGDNKTKVQKTKEFLSEIVRNEELVKLWGDVHEFNPEEVKAVAMKFAQEDCDRYNSHCLCRHEKGPEPSGELHGITKDELVAKFMPPGSLEGIKKDRKRRKALELFLRDFTKTEDGYIWNECPDCGRRWPYEFAEERLARFFRYKTATEKLSEDIFHFIDYLNRYAINPTGPLYYIEDTWPEDAIDDLRQKDTHICLVPLQVIYYYAHLQRDKFKNPEQIFELDNLSEPMSEYYGRFRPELESVLVERFGIK